MSKNHNKYEEKTSSKHEVEDINGVDNVDSAAAQTENSESCDSCSSEECEAALEQEVEELEGNESQLREEIDSLRADLEKEKKEYMFLMAEFDNFRKRTLKEKSEIIKNAGENVLKGLLPIVDDFERGLKASEESSDAAVRDGMVLIYNKLKKYLEQNGVKEFDPDDLEFDADRHEAISAVPVPDDALKGKILDTVEKGYMINDKVLRHAKVVVGK